MSRIFLAFHGQEKNGQLPIFYEAFVKSLKKLNHEVRYVAHEFFSPLYWDNQTQIPEDLKKLLVGFNPDLCIIFNNSFFNLGDVVKCPIIIYEVDSIFYYSNIKKIFQRPKRYHFFASTESRDILTQGGGFRLNKFLKSFRFHW